MATPRTPKTSRLEMRLTENQRARIEQAASLQGLSISQWAVNSLMEAADKDIIEEKVIRLSDQAYDSLLEIINEPMPEETVQLLKKKPVWG